MLGLGIVVRDHWEEEQGLQGWVKEGQLTKRARQGGPQKPESH